jgi:hypothetical protein
MDVSPPLARIQIIPSTGLKTGSRRNSRQHQPLMGICLHQHPIHPLVLPPARDEGGDIFGRTLGPVLDVVAAEARQLLVHWAQHIEKSEQMHRQSHPHEHLTEVDKDRHQRDGV